MRAVFFKEHGGAEKLLEGDFPDPRPGPGEALLKIRACALNHLDLWTRQGIPSYPIELPHIPGCDISGEIAEVHAAEESIHPNSWHPPHSSGYQPGAKGAPACWKPGDRVLVAPGISCFQCEACLKGRDNLCDTYRILGADGGQGGYAQYVRVPLSNLLPLPPNISFEEGAAFPLTHLTAWHMMITLGELKPAQTVLVVGAGSGVGCAAIQIAKLSGARVLAVSSSPEKLEKARRLGADETLSSSSEFQRQALRVTGGSGVDLVIEHVGPATLTRSLKALKRGGKLILCGATTGPTWDLDLRYVFSRQLRIQGSRMGTLSELQALWQLLEQGKLKPVIDRSFPLKEARQAQERMQDKKQFGKILLIP
ncbi:MAG: zinc-binding dehydrogenase [Elusimicrobia bacterium]|nr:zinc-binding dehydrogenase [Elusimicrobiota bacterium]